MTVRNTDIYFPCRHCKKVIPITQQQKIVKCMTCGAASKVTAMIKNASCEVSFTSEHTRTSAMFFTDVISKVLLSKGTDIPEAKESDIECAFLELEDIKVSVKKHKIIDIEIN